MSAAVDRHLISLDIWANDWRRFDVAGARAARSCPCCGEGQFEFVRGDHDRTTTSLCGRDAVQVLPARTVELDLSALAERLAPHGTFHQTPFLLRGELAAERGPDGESIQLTIFPDGRILVRGTTEITAARTLCDRYIGS